MAFVGSDMQGSESIPYTIYPVHVHPRLQKGTDRTQVMDPAAQHMPQLPTKGHGTISSSTL